MITKPAIPSSSDGDWNTTTESLQYLIDGILSGQINPEDVDWNKWINKTVNFDVPPNKGRQEVYQTGLIISLVVISAVLLLLLIYTVLSNRNCGRYSPENKSKSCSSMCINNARVVNGFDTAAAVRQNSKIINGNATCHLGCSTNLPPSTATDNGKVDSSWRYSSAIEIYNPVYSSDRSESYQQPGGRSPYKFAWVTPDKGSHSQSPVGAHNIIGAVGGFCDGSGHAIHRESTIESFKNIAKKIKNLNRPQRTHPTTRYNELQLDQCSTDEYTSKSSSQGASSKMKSIDVSPYQDFVCDGTANVYYHECKRLHGGQNFVPLQVKDLITQVFLDPESGKRRTQCHLLGVSHHSTFPSAAFYTHSVVGGSGYVQFLKETKQFVGDEPSPSSSLVAQPSSTDSERPISDDKSSTSLQPYMAPGQTCYQTSTITGPTNINSLSSIRPSSQFTAAGQATSDVSECRKPMTSSTIESLDKSSPNQVITTDNRTNVHAVYRLHPVSWSTSSSMAQFSAYSAYCSNSYNQTLEWDHYPFVNDVFRVQPEQLAAGNEPMGICNERQGLETKLYQWI